MSNLALSNSFTANFYNLQFDDALTELIDNLIVPTSITKLEKVIELIDFYSLRASIYHQSVSSLPKLTRYTGGPILDRAEDSTTLAFNALIEVSPHQGANGSQRIDEMVNSALIPARKYLFDIKNSIQAKKNAVLQQLAEVRALNADVKASKKKYLNHSETLHQFEMANQNELVKLMGNLKVSELNEKKAMMGDPEKDEVLLDKDKFIAKEEYRSL
ncbi:unnamed protein product [Ambrosiozyma monospora]|uniref:Unnamed protein product n=1 Tax=Ambrosiozyma monospora TaxID=43982 RepID=A0A9W6YN84_AMBMO|nr:unnamed protein product [Ambrosiozyma monospora]